MAVNGHTWNFEIAQRLRQDAAGACDTYKKRRLLNLARVYDIEVELVSGSVQAIAESLEVIARANKLLGL